MIINNILEILKEKRWNILSRIIKENNVRQFIEVGVYRGENLSKLAKMFPMIEFVGVDSYDMKNYVKQNSDSISRNKDLQDAKEECYKKIDKLNNVALITCDSVAFSKGFKNNKLDMVFIDGNHTYEQVKKDIKAWLPKVKKGGILCGHDYLLASFGVIKAVDETLGSDNVRIMNDGIWVHKK